MKVFFWNDLVYAVAAACAEIEAEAPAAPPAPEASPAKDEESEPWPNGS